MESSSLRMRQVVDWSAAIWSGVIAGFIFLLLNVILTPIFIGGNGWVIIRLFASTLLGPDVLAPPATYEPSVLLAALASHFALSILFSLILALLIHRGGLITGILGGALFGLALYLINIYTLTLFFPWFFAMRSWIFVLTHILFGSLAGGIYEGLEVEEFVPAE